MGVLVHHVLSPRPSEGRTRLSTLSAPVAALVALLVALTGFLALGLGTSASAAGESVVNRLRPTISGTAKLGAELSVDKGVWSPADATLSVQWLRGGVAIEGATGDTYLLVDADKDTMVSARVTGAASGSPSVAATSAEASVKDCGVADLLCLVAPAKKSPTNSAAPAITGEPHVGAVLTASAGTWAPASTYLYQWYADGAVIDGANAATLTVTASQLGDPITVKVYATANGLSGSDTSAPTVAIAPDPNAFTVVGTPTIDNLHPRVGDTLTAAPGSWSPDPTYAYQWLKDGNKLLGATDPTLKLEPGSAYLGSTISVEVTATAEGKTPTTVRSGSTSPVAAVSVPPSDNPDAPDTTKAEPFVRVKVRGRDNGDVIVKAKVTAAGLSSVKGAVRFKVTRGGGKAEVVTLKNGRAKVVLKTLLNGKHKAKVRYLGSSKVGKSVKVVVPFATF